MRPELKACVDKMYEGIRYNRNPQNQATVISGHLIMDSYMLPDGHPLKLLQGEESQIDEYIFDRIRDDYNTINKYCDSQVAQPTDIPKTISWSKRVVLWVKSLFRSDRK